MRSLKKKLQYFVIDGEKKKNGQEEARDWARKKLRHGSRPNVAGWLSKHSLIKSGRFSSAETASLLMEILGQKTTRFKQ